ncbi:MarR family transcriptional regulator [Rhizomonospora bruguierae]|uniref:MarR family transcriptional regulator n=1 Tax=Rhizomonospora bruguierae TaxID=1581705 RepID=UPI001BD088A7|nr:MarR family transcriptional regulator [Micromonospora sp. NBRC 107566]
MTHATAGAASRAGNVFFLLRGVRAKFSSDAADSRDFLILDTLGGQDWASQIDLAERLGINRTIMVQVIDRLEERGEVQRTRDPGNRRQYVLSLTDRGRAALEERRRIVAERGARLTSALTRREAARLDALLARLLPEAVRPLVQGTENLVAQADLRLRRQGDDKLAGTGLRLRFYRPLSALVAAGPCAQQELAEVLAITRPAASQLVDELVKPGLVRRDRDPHDRRRYALEVTEAGRTALTVIAMAVQELTDEVEALLGPGGEDALRALLLKIKPRPPRPEPPAPPRPGHHSKRSPRSARATRGCRRGGQFLSAVDEASSSALSMRPGRPRLYWGTPAARARKDRST